MKILFLAGSFEPGKDGVGDYTRTLATECARLGHETFLLGLNDPWINAPVLDRQLLRLGAKASWPDRVSAAQSFLTENRPDMVSLQFVPYSFHPAGLNFALPQLLGSIIGQTPVQTMFHELWTGCQVGAPAKARILGFCQRKIIKATVRNLGSQLIHTSNSIYIQLLRPQGIDAKHLPLCGSVPIVLAENLPRRGDNILRLALFGSIHPEWFPNELFARLRILGRPIQLSHIGRIGPGESVWMDLTKRYESEIELHRLGEQSTEKISEFFSSVDFGISTTPLSLIGKSSCVAAMLDHGLPVIVNRNDVHFAGISAATLASELLIPMDERFLERLTSARRQPPKARLPEVAAQFLSDIGA
jgi:hypothetical protein